MPSKKPQIRLRKAPKQARSEDLVAAVLEAAVRVLEKYGARRFTTVRVAEQAGVSVGSLYQYFPNKEAILFRLQADEWETTWREIDGILADTRLRPFPRLRRAVVAFFRSEHAEAGLRAALDDASALFRDAPEARALEAKAKRRVAAFVDEVLPEASPSTRSFAADFVLTTMSAIAEEVTATPRTPAEVDTWAETYAALIVTFLRRTARTAR